MRRTASERTSAATRAPEPTRSVVIAGASRDAASRAARAAGLEPVLTLTKSDCAAGLADTRRRLHDLGIGTVAIHSDDWSRQHMPQSLELAAARLRLPDCRIVNSDGSMQLRLGRRALAARVARLPLEIAGGLSLAAAEAVHLRSVRHRPAAFRPSDCRRDVVLAVWIGSGADIGVGGAATHVSGVLGGFRNVGLRVVLVSVDEPPRQVRNAIDDFIQVPPMSRRARVTADITAIGSNRYARDAIERATTTLRPAFIYQRHEAYITAGVEVAQRRGIPVVLEWNSSQLWTRTNWNELRRLNRLLLPLLAASESYVARRSDVVAAVSEHSGRMATAAGAPTERVAVVPNGVDIRAIDAGIEGATWLRDESLRLIGWVGSFGPWHGAPVLVEAMALLPPRVRAVMIGDGKEREACETLARRLGVWERIDWTGALPHREAIRRLAECDVLASPHVPLEGQAFFGSPTKLFEYMAIGRPIVASALEQIAEVLEDGRTARLVEPGNAAELAGAIEELLREPERALRLGTAARVEAERVHRWEDRSRSILDRLLGPDHAPFGMNGATRPTA